MSALLFSLQVKLGREVVKVPVLTNDSIGQLLSRLAEVARLPPERRDAIGTKLNQQLRHLLEQDKLSEKVRRKIMNLLGKEERQERSPEAHFRIMRESLDRARPNGQLYQKKHFKYLQEGPNLNVKYPSGEVDTLINHRQVISHPESHSDNAPIPHYSNEDSALIRKYEALDRKCNEYISKNIRHNNVPQGYEAITDRTRNKIEEQHPQGRHSFPLQRTISPMEVDRKFAQLNLEALKTLDQMTAFTHHSQTQRPSPISRSPQPFRPGRAAKRYNYLNMQP